MITRPSIGTTAKYIEKQRDVRQIILIGSSQLESIRRRSLNIFIIMTNILTV